jgi:hypothetical protein
MKQFKFATCCSTKDGRMTVLAKLQPNDVIRFQGRKGMIISPPAVWTNYSG